MAMAFLLTALLCLAAGPLAVTFKMPAAGPVIRVLSLNFLLLSLAFVPTVVLRKEMKFDKLSKIWIFAALINAIVGVTLALSGAGYWSLVIAQLAGSSATVFVAVIFRPEKRRMTFSVDEAKALLNIGGRVFAASLLVFLGFNIDNFLIGAMAGPVALGAYGLAFNWSTQLCVFISGTVHTVLFPALSSNQGDLKVVKAMYLKSVRYMGLVAAVGYAVLAFVSREFLIQVLGRGTMKWEAAIPVLQILCIYGLLRQLLEPLAGPLLAIGRADLLWRSALIVFIIELIGVYVALHFSFGIVGVAMVVTATYAVQFVYYAPHIARHLDVSYWNSSAPFAPALVSFTIVASLGFFVQTASSWPLLFVRAGVAGLLVLPTYWFSGGKAEMLDVRDRLASQLGRASTAS